MRKSRFSAEQITMALRQAEAETRTYGGADGTRTRNLRRDRPAL